MSDKITLALADDHKLVTDSLKDFLKKNISCDILFVAKDGKELIHNIFITPVDILILDINMPKMDGLEALKIIKSRKPDQKVIVLSMFDDEALLLKLVKLHVNGYLSKSGPGGELLKAIRDVRDKGHYFTERLVQVMYNETAQISKQRTPNEVYAKLDDIDKDILVMLCDEFTSKEMAERLYLSARSIEGRRKKLLKTVGVKNQAGLIIYAIKHGIVKI